MSESPEKAWIPKRLGDIPVRADDVVNGRDCDAAEPFVLMVLGDAMAPEFVEGDVIVVEPDGRAVDGAFVVAFWQGEWRFSQLREDAGWCLRPVNPSYPEIRIPDLAGIRGVVIQKSRPGRRRECKRYVD